MAAALRRTDWCIVVGVAGCLASVGGCGAVVTTSSAPLFEVPLSIEGDAVGVAVIDTGGGYEIMLREPFGLEIIDIVEVLAFGGYESVEVTEGFTYTAGGIRRVVDAAILGKTICDCSGLGFLFFRNTGLVLKLDFVTSEVSFVSRPPAGGVTIPFAPPPPTLDGFDTAFIAVTLTSDGESKTVLALFDTGAGVTLVRRGLVGSPGALLPDRQDVTLSHDLLGTVGAQVGLFDTPGLPDIIVGTDVMSVWGNQWYFTFTPTGGSLTVIRSGDLVESRPDAAARTARPYG